MCAGHLTARTCSSADPVCSGADPTCSSAEAMKVAFLFFFYNSVLGS